MPALDGVQTARHSHRRFSSTASVDETELTSYARLAGTAQGTLEGSKWLEYNTFSLARH